MKLAYVYLNNLKSGSANVNQTLNMVNAFSTKCNTTFISSWISNNDLDNELNFLNLRKKFEHKKIPVSLVTSNWILEQITRLIYSILVYTHLKLNSYDVIYTRDFSFLYFLSLLPKSWGFKNIVFEPHVIYHLTSVKVKKEQEEKSLKIPSFFTPISNGIAEDLNEIFNIKKEKIFVSPDGVNLDLYSNLSISKTSDKTLICYTGSFKSWKGLDTLVKAIPKIEGNNFEVLIAGKGNEEEENYINQLINKLGITNKVRLLGFLSQEKVVKIISKSHIAILPNNTELISEKYTSPLKAFEYMAGGTAIVASKLPSLIEIFEENKNCIFFQPNNENDLADKINLLVKNRPLTVEISDNNINSVKQYSWERRASNLVDEIGFFSKEKTNNI